MWLRYWGLASDPFAGPYSPYVPLPSHDEALARLNDSFDRCLPLVAFVAGAGLGKTTVVRRAIAAARHPRRRFAAIHLPTDRGQLLGGLADALGLPSAVGSGGPAAWRSVARAVRAAALEGSQVVFVVDGWDENPDAAALQDLTALLDAGRQSGVCTSLVRVGRREPRASPEQGDSWRLAIRLERLTRSQAETYVEAKLAAAGSRERVFTPRALTRLHAWSEGVPRGLDRLAAIALMAGAVQGLEAVSPDLVDAAGLQSVVGVNLDPIAR